jgi:hypothetical protein
LANWKPNIVRDKAIVIPVIFSILLMAIDY